MSSPPGNHGASGGGRAAAIVVMLIAVIVAFSADPVSDATAASVLPVSVSRIAPRGALDAIDPSQTASQFDAQSEGSSVHRTLHEYSLEKAVIGPAARKAQMALASRLAAQRRSPYADAIDAGLDSTDASAYAAQTAVVAVTGGVKLHYHHCWEHKWHAATLEYCLSRYTSPKEQDLRHYYTYDMTWARGYGGGCGVLCNDHLYGLAAGVWWDHGVLYKQSPSQTIHPAGCHTATVGFGIFGAGLSTSYLQCPDTVTPSWNTAVGKSHPDAECTWASAQGGSSSLSDVRAVTCIESAQIPNGQAATAHVYGHGWFDETW